MILDEAQAIKNPGAKQTRAVKALRGAGAPRAHRHAGREPPRRSVVDLRLPDPGPARLGEGVRPRSTKKLGGRRADGYAPLRSLVRPYILRRLKTDKRDHRRPARQDRGARVLRAHARRRPRSISRRSTSCASARRTAGRHRAARRRPRVPHALQADLQPPVAVARRRRLGAAEQRQARAPRARSASRSRRGRRRCSSSRSSAR